MYDYGRPRELHLERTCTQKVARYLCAALSTPATPTALADGREELAKSDYFRIERLKPKESISLDGSHSHYSILTHVKGEGMVDGKPSRAGQAYFVPAASACAVRAPRL